MEDTIESDDVLFCRLSPNALYYATPSNQDNLGMTKGVARIWFRGGGGDPYFSPQTPSGGGGGLGMTL